MMRLASIRVLIYMFLLTEIVESRPGQANMGMFTKDSLLTDEGLPFSRDKRQCCAVPPFECYCCLPMCQVASLTEPLELQGPTNDLMLQIEPTRGLYEKLEK